MNRTGQVVLAGGCVLLLMVTFSVVHGHDWMAPKEAAERANPIAADPVSIERGQAVYAENCATCHGERMEGLGIEQTGLAQPTPNLRTRAASHSDGDFFWKVQNGRGEMPGFKDDLSEQQIWDVVNYINHAPK